MARNEGQHNKKADEVMEEITKNSKSRYCFYEKCKRSANKKQLVRLR